MYKAILFDMDGTLVDTEGLNMEVTVMVCQELGLELDIYEREQTIGVTNRKFYEELFENRGVNFPIEEILNRHFEIYNFELKKDLKLFEGVIDLFNYLKQRGYRLGLVSGSTRKQIDIVLNQINATEYFEIIVSADDIKNSKPHPEGYILGAEKLGLMPEQCLVIEDSIPGIQAARAAGMNVIGVQHESDQDLSAATLVVKNLVEIIAQNSIS